MPQISKTFIAPLLCGLLVTGCGGSTSGGAGTAASGAATTFPLSTALFNLNATGFKTTLAVNGTEKSISTGVQGSLTGSLDVTETPAYAGFIFENQPARQETFTLAGIFNTNLPFSSTNQSFLSTNNLLLGVSSPTSYCVASTPGQYPKAISIGQAQSVVTYNCYTDSTKASPIGTGKLSFLVGAGNSPETATFSTIETFMDPTGLQILYTQKNFLIDTSGSISFLSLSFSGLLTSASGGPVNDIQLSFKAQ